MFGWSAARAVGNRRVSAQRSRRGSFMPYILTEADRTASSVCRKTFQDRELSRLLVETPKGVAAEDDGRGDVDNVVSAEAILRRVSLSDPSESGCNLAQ